MVVIVSGHATDIYILIKIKEKQHVGIKGPKFSANAFLVFLNIYIAFDLSFPGRGLIDLLLTKEEQKNVGS